MSPLKNKTTSSDTVDAVRIVRMLIDAANRLDLRAPTKVSKDNLAELMSYLKALRECYQTMHWTARGSHYYGDHLLFERLYNDIVKEIDSLAEKSIGYTDDAYVVEVQYQTARTATHVAEIMSHLPDMTYIQCMLFAENHLCKEIIPQMLNTLEQANELSDGVENFLQGLSDNHEGHIYHLQRRLKTQEDAGRKAPVEPNISPPPEPKLDVEEQFKDMLGNEASK